MTRAGRVANPYFAFLVLTSLIVAIATHLSHSAHRAVIRAAASFDLTITVTFLYYWLLVRTGHRSRLTMFFVATFGLWRASFLFPEVVPGRMWIGAAIEGSIMAVVGAGIWRARKVRSDRDPLERLEAAFSAVIPVPAVARMLAAECGVLYYALNWRARPHVPRDATPLTMHKQTMAADLFYSIALVSLLEIVPVHLLASHWSRVLAWVLTSVTVYGAIWLVDMARAFALRPTLAGPDGITIRYGLLFCLHANRFTIASEQPAGAYALPRGTKPSFCITFDEPATAQWVAGIQRPVKSLALSFDPMSDGRDAASILIQSASYPLTQ